MKKNETSELIVNSEVSSEASSEVSELAPSGWKTSFSPMYRRRKCNQRRHAATF